jgi:hypothetical protein
MALIIIFGVVTVVTGALTKVPAIGFTLGALATVAFYIRDVKRHNRVPCRWPGCRGSGAESSRIGGGDVFRNPFGDCWCCGGRKSHPRLALWLIDKNEYDRLRGEVKKGRKAIRDHH